MDPTSDGKARFTNNQAQALPNGYFNINHDRSHSFQPVVSNTDSSQGSASGPSTAPSANNHSNNDNLLGREYLCNPPTLSEEQINALIEVAKLEVLALQNPTTISANYDGQELTYDLTDNVPRSPPSTRKHHRSGRKRKHTVSNASYSSSPSRPLGMRKQKKQHGRRQRRCRSRHYSYSSSSSDDSLHNRSKVKFGAFRKYSDQVQTKFKGPNEYIGHEKGVSPTYDELSFTELILDLFQACWTNFPGFEPTDTSLINSTASRRCFVTPPPPIY